ncbi:hypothetical protein DTO013E5_8975 [Penicillium roqueforti]|uniref:Uncharacterized protein n=1 Tax=Penicillium roqueforti (strain FM164) TaxID=1365484 RepID=W6QIE7_PENRF|nr:uncharacterized protein LCP9604111_9146 [Penicillium roqueforti]CDM36200.1 unnamed protein product [Penicillium roqueforti FM164]KAF9239381.1 hypothetical protein LCP9604111_9146 [Penicillium roqueforti]KAI2670737.1 hypothetical protein CBS147355_9072 [Penicillium roqueforti]KAI2684139.1 hypothetical protein LCP963914a_5439 [Penicillium roqueforti]KAI2697741.1 hypothetical protein CBS147332_8724 [Penicillium roqueforti]
MDSMETHATPKDAENEQSITQRTSSPYPSHPIAQLQGPFEESIVETTDGSVNKWVVDIDAQTRRRDLLENDEYERLCGRKWRQRASEKYHPFWKLISQMVFGVHLLAKSLAKSEDSVMRILQKHVDELDGFLERTTEDFMIVRLDVRTRIQYLRVPLGNLDVFDEMLEDRNFRLSIVAYNDQIEHSIERFTLSITDSLKDLQKAKEAMSALWFYFRKLTDEDCFKSESLKLFHQAMMDNMEGWIVAISKLRRRGTALQKALTQLGLATTEMQRRVGVASRKDVRSFIKQTSKTANRNKSIKQRLFDKGRPKSEKPLPRDPLSKPKRTSTASKQVENPSAPARAQTDTPTDLPIPSDGIRRRIMSRARSCSALIAEASAGAGTESPPPLPSTSGKLKRKLSKPFLLKRSASVKIDLTQSRPKTAPSQPSRLSRNISIEQLRAFCSTPRPQTGQSRVKSPTQARQEAHNQLTNGRENMKEQISQFLKTDRVVEAWDNVSKNTCCTLPITKTKDWPSSVFQAKSSTLENKGNDTNPDLDRQMSWIQGKFDVLPTYSFKTKPDMSPRIHVLSVQMTHDNANGVTEREASLDLKSEFGSSITALPVVPSSIPPIALEHRSRLIDCAQG